MVPAQCRHSLKPVPSADQTLALQPMGPMSSKTGQSYWVGCLEPAAAAAAAAVGVQCVPRSFQLLLLLPLLSLANLALPPLCL